MIITFNFGLQYNYITFLSTSSPLLLAKSLTPILFYLGSTGITLLMVLGLIKMVKDVLLQVNLMTIIGDLKYFKVKLKEINLSMKNVLLSYPTSTKVSPKKLKMFSKSLILSVTRLLKVKSYTGIVTPKGTIVRRPSIAK